LSPANLAISHLLALYTERAGDFDSAVPALETVCNALEEQYEKTESDDLLLRSAQAKADLARCLLGLHRFDDAVEAAEYVLDLTGDDSLSGPAYQELRSKARLSAYLTAGLGHSHLQHVDKAIRMFSAALEEIGPQGDADVNCLLAQVLWAKGGENEREVARGRLMSALETDEGTEHVQTVCLLGVIGLSDNDQEVLEIVAETLEGLRVNSKVRGSQKVEVVKVLAGIKAVRGGTGDAEEAIFSAVRSVMVAPEQPGSWVELFEATGQEVAGDFAVKNAERMMPPGGELDAEEVAGVLSSVGAGEGSNEWQISRMMAPWVGVDAQES
jgi:superkiller protein 3